MTRLTTFSKIKKKKSIFHLILLEYISKKFTIQDHKTWIVLIIIKFGSSDVNF